MTDKELMKMALDALETYGAVTEDVYDVIEALRTALAQPEQVLCRLCSGHGWFTYPASDVRFECPECIKEKRKRTHD